MGTEPVPGASDPVSPPAEEAKPHQPADDTGLPPEVEDAVQQVLAAQPGLPIPPEVRTRITDALRAEAATRAALAGNDIEPAPSVDQFGKAARPVREHEELS